MAANGIFLTDEQRMIRDMARDFAEGELAPHAGRWDLNGGYPDDILPRMGRLGLMGMLVPPEWDGAGADHVAYALAMEEIAAGDVGTSTAMSVNNSLVCAGILKGGSEEQKERFLRPLARGDMLGCFCLTEPQAGSDASNLRTRAVPDGNGYRLSGTKQFVSSGSRADVAMVFAVTDPDAGKKGISCFLVPTESEGYTVASHETKMGQRAHDTCQIVFEDVRLTPDLMLGESGAGLCHRARQPRRRPHRGCGPGDRRHARGLRGCARLRQGAHELRQAADRASGGGLSASPTWRRRSRPRGCSRCRPRGCAMPASPA